MDRFQSEALLKKLPRQRLIHATQRPGIVADDRHGDIMTRAASALESVKRGGVVFVPPARQTVESGELGRRLRDGGRWKRSLDSWRRRSGGLERRLRRSSCACSERQDEQK